MLFDEDYYRVRYNTASFRPQPCRCIEVLHYKDVGIIVREELCPPGQVLKWIKRDLAESIRGGLRLIVSVLLPTCFLLSREDTDFLVNYLHLPPAFLSLPFEPSDVHHSRDWDTYGVQSWHIRGTDLQRAGISYDRHTRIVSGILIIDEHSGMDHNQWVQQIKESRDCAINLMLLPTLLASSYIKQKHKRSGGITDRLADLKNLVGVPSLSDPSVRAFFKDPHKRIKEAADLRAEISDSTVSLAWLTGCIVLPTRECIKTFQQSLANSKLKTSMDRETHLVGKELDERMELVQQGEVWLSAMVKDHVAKADTTISGLYAMLAFRGNENNLHIASRALETAEQATAIAIETKRDSSTMTSIAALIMAFLLGTLVAEDFWKSLLGNLRVADLCRACFMATMGTM
ncbi:hypothetical protein F5Y04DRAFT_292600 [Hypomontagnella monticulosa]|nr:hypothetical protein F5Y04DRAFT_292600 [Hypomontagnella monticulosa]